MRKCMLVFMIIFVMMFGTVFATAAPDDSVTIVSPSHESTIYSDSLLVSVKVTEAKTFRITVYEEKRQAEDGTMVSLDVASLADIDAVTVQNVVVGSAETFVSTSNLSFYTKQISDVTPGVYRVKVESLNSANQAAYITNSYFIVRDPAEKPATEVFETQQTGLLKSLQSFLKNLFGS